MRSLSVKGMTQVLNLILFYCKYTKMYSLEVSLKDESFSNVFLLYESFITFLIFFFSECFILAKGLVFRL
jgi:hypothetical protein